MRISWHLPEAVVYAFTAVLTGNIIGQLRCGRCGHDWRLADPPMVEREGTLVIARCPACSTNNTVLVAPDVHRVDGAQVLKPTNGVH